MCLSPSPSLPPKYIFLLFFFHKTWKEEYWWGKKSNKSLNMKSRKHESLHINIVSKTCTYYTFQRVNVWATILHLHILFSTSPPLRWGGDFSIKPDHLIYFPLNFFLLFFSLCYSLLSPLSFLPLSFPHSFLLSMPCVSLLLSPPLPYHPYILFFL